MSQESCLLVAAWSWVCLFLNQAFLTSGASNQCLSSGEKGGKRGSGAWKAHEAD